MKRFLDRLYYDENGLIDMDDNRRIEKVLKIVGIAALVAVPIFFLVKRLRTNEAQKAEGEDTNIFTEDLAE
jgi:hypothetical protein